MVTVTNRIVSTTSGETTTVVTNQISSNLAQTYFAGPIDAVSAQYTNKVSVAYTNYFYDSGVYETTVDGVTTGVSTNAFQATYTNVVTATVAFTANWGTFYFDGDVAFKGTNAYTFANNGTSMMRCGINGMVYFTPDDITGNASPDVTINMPIDDGPAPYQNFTTFPVPSNFGKKGAGTLRLSYLLSTFSGNIDVAAGVLEVYAGSNGENKVSSCVGNPQVANRQMLVRSGSELYFYQSDTLGQLASSVKMATVISNATLRLADNTCNGFGPLTLYNANVIYKNGITGSKLWGLMGLGGKTVFDGTNAYTFAVLGNYNQVSLGYGTDFSIDSAGGTTNYNGKTEFEIRNITTNANTDVNVEVPLQDIPAWASTVIFKKINFKCGLIKSGVGTLRLGSTINTYTGPTLVTQGVLRVDGSLTTSAVTVKSGAYLAGTGTVSNVTLEDGAGFDVFANQTVPLKVGALTVANGGKIVVHNPAGSDRTTLNAPFMQVTGSVVGTFDPSKWTVIMEGVASTPNLRVRVTDGVAYARWAPMGTMIGVR